jgi:CIC family chloride channel protein
MTPMPEQEKTILKRPRLRKYAALFSEDLAANYSRDLHKWLFVAPVIGLLAGFVLTGFIMQNFTPNPNEHSTEEIIRSCHEHQGDIEMRCFLPKLAAAVTTVGLGGSAALEGPSIYGGGAIGSWLWGKLRRFKLEPQDQRIMLISGAAAGMAAVFRAPVTGLVFALEMPYKDDLAHEALVPSLIASVVAYGTLASFLGSRPLFDFAGATSFSGKDLFWSAVLGAVCGLIAMAFNIIYRQFRTFAVRCSIAHWMKLAAGGLLTGLCGLAFVSIFKGSLIPIGPNYEAVDRILMGRHTTIELALFGIFKLAATLFTLGSGGVSAMFVPLFLTGASVGTAFNQAVVHSPSADLYAAVGMAAFIAGGYKAPLAAVVFVAEATGGHAFIIPALVGAAVAYAVSGEASVSVDQRLHEGVRMHELGYLPVRMVMQKEVVLLQASSSLQALADAAQNHAHHTVFPVYEGDRLLGTAEVWSLWKIEPGAWPQTTVRAITEEHPLRILGECDVMEALRLLKKHAGQHILLITSNDGQLEGVVTKTDILGALEDHVLRSTQSGTFERSPSPLKL